MKKKLLPLVIILGISALAMPFVISELESKPSNFRVIPSNDGELKDFDNYKEVPICQSTREACQIPPMCINKYFECDVVGQEIFEEVFETDYTEKFD